MTPRTAALGRVWVTGLGFITPIGNNREAVSANLRAGQHGLAAIEYFSNPAISVKLAGTVKDFSVNLPNRRQWHWPQRYEIPRETARSLSPHGVYAFCALQQALADAGLAAGDIANDDMTGLYTASAGSAMLMHHHLAEMHATRGERIHPLGVVSSIAGTLNFSLAAHFKITGSVCGFVSACASSSHALGYALDDLRLGRLHRAIVVGAEEANPESLLPFAAMRALSAHVDPRSASRPFDAQRDGFVGAEGATVLILETEQAARGRGRKPYAELGGWGQAADGHSVASSHPEGAGLRIAMTRALADAQVAGGDVDYINAHATSTPVGDRAEAIALQAVFTARGHHPVVSSTKGLTGHPLSMSGAMEVAFCCLALADGFQPGNAHLGDPDAACAGLELPVTTLSQGPNVALSNSSGFGGSNVCHVLRQA